MFLACLALAWCRCGAARQAAPGGPVRIDSLCVQIFFERDIMAYDPLYRSNAARIDSFVQRFRLLRADTLCSIRDIEVVSSASPEGSHSRNLRLSQQRANVLIGLLEKRVTLNDLNLNVRSIGSDWATLERMVEADTHMPRRDEALRIIRHTPPLVYDDRRNIVSSRVKQLMDLDGGRVWWYMDEKFFPELRQSGVRVVCRFEHQDTPPTSEPPAAPVVPALPVIPPAPEVPDIEPPEPAQADTLWLSIVPVATAPPHDTISAVVPVAATLPHDTLVMHSRDTLVVITRDTLVVHSRDTVWMIGDGAYPGRPGTRSRKAATPLRTDRILVAAVRTNLLLPLCNVGVEVPLGNRWSVALDHHAPWIWPSWGFQSREHCFELMFETLELRRWMGRRHDNWGPNHVYRLTGHSIGLFAGGGYYDLATHWEGHQGELWAGGLDYLYAFSNAKGTLHWEFSLGVGYMTRSERAYEVLEEGGKKFRKPGGSRHAAWVGPLRASVALVLPIYRKTRKEVRQ